MTMESMHCLNVTPEFKMTSIGIVVIPAGLVSNHEVSSVQIKPDYLAVFSSFHEFDF